ncbi:MAG: T9SS type A sorting domain-containing protein [Phycisphaerales bacterium]|nr:T9SS type A sorting domain-containing protein [Phycisphaerales bacterium]
MGTDYWYNYVSNDYTFYLFTGFSFGSGGGCPKIAYVKSALSNDTIYIKAFYDIRGYWAAMGCDNFDSVKYKNNFSGVNFFNVSTNAIKNIIDEFHTDTLWNLYDTTFVLGTSGFIDVATNNDESFAVYPNPATNYIDLQQVKNKDWADLDVLNALGQVVIRQRGSVQKPTRLDISQIANGFYFIALYDRLGNKIGRAKFYKQE